VFGHYCGLYGYYTIVFTLRYVDIHITGLHCIYMCYRFIVSKEIQLEESFDEYDQDSSDELEKIKLTLKSMY